MKHRLYILLLALLAANMLHAQMLKFNKSYGGPSEDQGRAVKQTFDKGYIVAGATSSMGAGNMDVYLIKADSMGMHQWSRTYGGINSEWGYSVLQVQDSGYVVAGYTNSFGAGGYDMYLIRTDKNGDTLWTKTYGGADWDFAYCVKQTTDGGYIIAGTTGSFGAGNDDVYLVKTDANGDTLWTKTFGGTGNEAGRSVYQNTDGGYFVNGYTNSAGNGGNDIYYIRTDAAGAVIWTKTLGGTQTDESYSGTQTFDGGFAMAGFTNSFSTGFDEAYIVKTDANGDTLWTQRYGAPNNARAYSIQETSLTDFIWCGYLEQGGNKDVYLFHTTASAIYLFSTTHGYYPGDDAGYSTVATSDGGFVTAGFTTNFGNGLADVYLVKTDNSGNSVAYNSIAEVSILQVKIFPNPVVSSAYITLPAELAQRKMLMEVTDITGRTVMSKSIDAHSRTIVFEREGLNAGVYFFSIHNEDRSLMAEGKLIIQ